ncbi:hypothetical protein BB561_002621 [Smittium simulii]|uniref:V-type proton ATPase subunit G n=1 Tax=Smittium simulii TaxID=133385 RepID=A0A2T9YPU3_9FUNG|nr:hypothetical protein BB561_002621 [Smittium simulii]
MLYPLDVMPETELGKKSYIRSLCKRNDFEDNEYLIPSNTNNQGIQALFEAEKEASKIVEHARSYRLQRLKMARDEAALEIKEFQKEKNMELERLQLTKEEQAELEATMQAETDTKINEIMELYAKNKDAALDIIFDATVNDI